MKSAFKKAIGNTKDFLTFNYAERRGIMVLVILIMLTESVNALLPRIVGQQSIDMTVFEDEVRQFEKAIMIADSIEKKEAALKKKKEAALKEKKTYPIHPAYKNKAFTERPPLIIEVNTADSAQLIKLYGIGPGFAGRILKYRGMLGGFFSIDQLLEVYGMDTSRLNGFRDNIRIDTSAIERINVNGAEFKTLLHHPYLDYETVRLIFNYREYVGPILNADTLRKVIAYDPMFIKVKPYINYRATNNEQQAPSNEQQAPSNEQRAPSNEQRAPSNEQRAPSNEQRAPKNKQ